MQSYSDSVCHHWYVFGYSYPCTVGEESVNESHTSAKEHLQDRPCEWILSINFTVKTMSDKGMTLFYQTLYVFVCVRVCVGVFKSE